MKSECLGNYWVTEVACAALAEEEPVGTSAQEATATCDCKRSGGSSMDQLKSPTQSDGEA